MTINQYLFLSLKKNNIIFCLHVYDRIIVGGRWSREEGGKVILYYSASTKT